MSIKDILMPANNFFNIDEIRSYANTVMYSFATCILIFSVIQEYLNDRHIVAPIKRFIVVVILLTVMPSVQSFIMDRSFEFSDGLMEIVSDQEKLEMVTDTDAFLDRLSEKQYMANTKEVAEEEEIDGEEFTVISKKTDFTSVITSQLMNIPNIAVATLTFAFIQMCISGMQLSYVIIYLFTGGLFAIPAVISILPSFEGSLEGAFKSLATLFTLPIVVSLLVALLSIKMYEFGEGGATAGASIRSVAVVCGLCFALAGSSAIAYGLVSVSGISQNLGAIGALGTGFLLSSTTSLGGSLIRNRESIFKGLGKGKNGILSGLKIGRNGLANGGGMGLRGISAMGSNMKSKSGVMGVVGKGIESITNGGGAIRSKYIGAKDKIASSIDHHSSHASPAGRGLGVLKTLGQNPDDFKKNIENMKMMKESGFKNVKYTGHSVPNSIMNAHQSNMARNTPIGPRWIKKGDLLFPSSNTGRQTTPLTGSRITASSKGMISSKSLSKSISNGGKFRPSANKKNYKLNNWEKKFLKDTSSKKSLSPAERKIKSNIEFVQRNGARAWEKKFVDNIENSARPTKKQKELYEKLTNKRG